MQPSKNNQYLVSDKGSNPFFSVIMPSYNYERFLPSAISSVIEQTFQNFELIIVDDYSKDGSASIITSWVQRDNRVRAILHEMNMGIAKTVNDGLENARGDYILLMSSDDMLRLDLLERILAIFKRYPDAGVIILEAAIIDEQDAKTGKTFSDVHKKPVLLSAGHSQNSPSQTHGQPPRILRASLFRELLRGNFIATGAFRHKLVIENGFLYSRKLMFLSDWLFWVDLASVSSFIYVEEPLYYYRLHMSTTSHHLEDMRAETMKAIGIIERKHWFRLDKRQKSSYIYLRSNFLRNNLGLRKEADVLLFKAILLKPTPSKLLALTKSLPLLSRILRNLSGRSNMIQQSARALEGLLN